MKPDPRPALPRTPANPLRLGVVGLGRAFTLMAPTFTQDSRITLVAATDPRESARAQFVRDFHGTAHASIEALCADPSVEAVYIATPHQMHADHVCLAAAHGKHVLVEKPMAIALADCTRMVEAAHAAGVQLIVGHSHSFNGPVLRARQLIDDETYGAVRMITALNFTDFLFRPRRPEELQTEQGGGVIFSQAAHQIDILRLLGGGEIQRLRAMTGAWDPTRPTEGAYSALFEFAGGAFATAVYSGYAHYDTDELQDWIGEMGRAKNSDDYGAARKKLARSTSPEEEANAKAAANYGGESYLQPPPPAPWHQHFGHIVVSCDHADLRITPRGVMVYGDESRFLDAVPTPSVPRVEVVDELWHAIRDGIPPLHNGRWARATTEACLAILESARSRRDIIPQHQISVADARATPSNHS